MYGPARANSDVIASVIASAKQEEVGTKGEREFQLLRYHPGGGGGGGGGGLPYETDGDARRLA